MDKEQHEYLSKKEIGYLAALVDLQGTFYIYEDSKDKSSFPELNLQIVVSSPDRNLLLFWKAKTGLGSVQISSYGYHWRTSAAMAEKLLRLVENDFLCAHTQEQARVALDFRKTFGSDRPLDEETVELRRYYRRVMLDLGEGGQNR